ncbi:AAA family ATPase [Ferrovum myxofaciens]|uniref:AAA family ATPase n=3 Tax=Ferrovum myxofaciens TaxID=416213 RepID=A0A9E6MX33_9PROT|nr:AAA family ATPase [Ferrovum myxofaciens]QWY77849.1 MAG: AAA family ATPase [Ferrovum myxofaciens]
MDQNGKMICISALFGIDAPEGAAVFVGNESLEINPGYVFHKRSLRKLLSWFDGEPGFQNLGIVGNAGVGKTTLVKEFCSRMGVEFRSVSVSGDTRFESLFGRREIRNGSTEYVEQGLAEMFRTGGVFCANEFFRMDPGEAMRMVEFLDSEGSLTNPETGEVIPRHPEFRFCFTGNSGGFGDESGAYAGERRGSFALRDRFFIMELPEMSEKDEQKMLIRAVPQLENTPFVERMVSAARAVRAAFVGRGGGLPVDISPRALVRWGNLFVSPAYQAYDTGNGVMSNPVIESLEDACLNGVPQDAREAVLELVKQWINID